jgi:2-alkyl-3-oxoalkanoate reductase
MSRILVTGTEGYLGSHIVDFLRWGGFTVIKAGRRNCDVKIDPSSPQWPEALKVDALIHSGWDMTASQSGKSDEFNLDGSCAFLKLASEQKLKKIIFISSISAYEEAKSIYGRNAFAAEQVAAQCGAITIRPGLVYGGKGDGLTMTLTKLIRKLPILPLIGGGAQKLYPCHVDDLCRFIQWLLEKAPDQQTALFTAASSTPLTFRQVLEKLAKKERKNPIFVPIPFWSLYYPLKTIESWGISLRTKSDSLVSLLNQNPSPYFESLQVWPGQFRSNLS